MNPYKPEQSNQELLDAIGKEADECAGNTALSLSPFATLLVKLSIEADKQTKRIVFLTWGLFILTIALLIFAGLRSGSCLISSDFIMSPSQ
ncbi:MAG: hypothetical protein HC904_16960 [Blastochloris sp.]|nr:hypothetical protein [Blastochloris sp.]